MSVRFCKITEPTAWSPNNTQFACAGVPVGDAHFWLIGRDPSESATTSASAGLYFGLVDEGSKLNLNYASTNALSYLPNMTVDFAQSIVEWCSTNESDSGNLDYSTLGYYPRKPRPLKPWTNSGWSMART